jgi:hypothetical protein
MGEVSDIVDDDDDTTVANNDMNDDNVSSDEDGESDDAVFLRAARDIMNRVGRKVGSAAVEDRRFREHFGAPFEIVRMVWDMMGEGHLLPEKSESKHLLWTLYFLKCYPKEGPGCATVGGSKGAIDPKTMRKWVWLLLERIGELADEVVSAFFPSRPSGIVISPRPPLLPSSSPSHETTDQLQEPSRRRRAQRLSHVNRRDRLLHPAEGGPREGERLGLPQVRGQIRHPIQARDRHPQGQPRLGRRALSRRRLAGHQDLHELGWEIRSEFRKFRWNSEFRSFF